MFLRNLVLVSAVAIGLGCAREKIIVETRPPAQASPGFSVHNASTTGFTGMNVSYTVSVPTRFNDLEYPEEGGFRSNNHESLYVLVVLASDKKLTDEWKAGSKPIARNLSSGPYKGWMSYLSIPSRNRAIPKASASAALSSKQFFIIVMYDQSVTTKNPLNRAQCLDLVEKIILSVRVTKCERARAN